ncbi:MAG TPA: HAMP domain-containing sensor histidine kinase [Rhizomicrobium sp.]|nr:HAMP domain-containing sensor histidine kinase [Rhizomicrobium sp.]
MLAAKIASRPRSLSARLIIAAAVWTILGLAAGGAILSGMFRTTVESNFDSQLKFDLDGMIAAAEPDRYGIVSLLGRFTDPRFERIYSGWYWQIVPIGDKSFQQSSRSLWDKSIKIEGATKSGNLTWGHAAGPDDQHLRVLERRVEFPITATADPSDTRSFVFLVAGDTAQGEANIAKFNGTLIWSFAILGLGLIVAIFIQVRIGLLPLRKVSESLARIRDGSARRLEGEFPSEIAPLAAELNSLIEHSAEVVGRARTHVSNLAHYLKTPLTILSSEASAQPGPLADAVQRQVGAMRRQVDHYLTRARAAGAVDVLGNRTRVEPALADLVRVLTRIHAERNIGIDLACDPNLFFRGERQDLEEMTGNLIDNACKWAKHSVKVTAKRINAKLQVTVDDDGPGLPPEDRARVFERGERLDESVPGTGLGLAIVRDIAKLYGGTLELNESPLGGLQTRLILPAIV